MARTRVIAGVALVLLGTACGGPPGAPQASPAEIVNVSGVLDRGPTPTCPTDEPCDPPLLPATLVFSRTGAPDVAVHVAADGSFAVHLEPGEYSISLASPVFRGKVEPPSVRIPATGAVFLHIRIESSP